MRNLKKNRVYSVINILGLAIGMAIALLIGLWMYDELTFDHFFDNHQRIAQVMSTGTTNGERRTGKGTLLPLGLQLEQGSAFTAVSLASWSQNQILSFGDVRISSNGMFVQPAFTDIFSLKMLEGDRDALKDPSSILLNASTAKALFGSKDAMGKTVKVANQYDMKVAGVFEDFPENTSLTRTHLLMPWDKFKTLNDHWYTHWEKEWDNHSFQLFALLNPHADIAHLERQLTTRIRTHPECVTESVVVHPMDRWRLYSEFKNGVS